MPVSSPTAGPWLRRAADYGGVLNAGLCLVHCAAGPLLLSFFVGHGGRLSEGWEVGFLLMSGLLVGLANSGLSAAGLRGALWGFFGLFGATMLLAGRWPALEWVQYAASVGLMGTHLLNLRHCRRCAGRPCAATAGAAAPAGGFASSQP